MNQTDLTKRPKISNCWENPMKEIGKLKLPPIDGNIDDWDRVLCKKLGQKGAGAQKQVAEKLAKKGGTINKSTYAIAKSVTRMNTVEVHPQGSEITIKRVSEYFPIKNVEMFSQMHTNEPSYCLAFLLIRYMARGHSKTRTLKMWWRSKDGSCILMKLYHFSSEWRENNSQIWIVPINKK